MFHTSTGGRASIAVIVAAFMVTTAACGTETAADVSAPGVVQEAPMHSSPDIIERRSALRQPPTPPVSPDAAERRSQQVSPPSPTGKPRPEWP